jgi:hypothetical protein
LLTYEDMTALFLQAASDVGLITHPEFWLNTRSLEREFTCTCHTGSCEDVELQSSCTLSFTWGALDTALSLEGPKGVCEFFHDPEHNCPHLHTDAIPPLVFELSYSLALSGTPISDETLLSLTQTLKLRASEQSLRTIETRPGISMVLHENQLFPETLTLQQRVEIPIWHPRGIHGLHDEPQLPVQRLRVRTEDEREYEELGEIVIEEPQPDKWLPRVLLEVCQDVLQVLAALDATVSAY